MDRKTIDNLGVVPLVDGRSRAAGSRRRPAGERRSVEELLDSLRGRRERLEDRLSLVTLAIAKLEDQLATKGRLAVL